LVYFCLYLFVYIFFCQWPLNYPVFPLTNSEFNHWSVMRIKYTTNRITLSAQSHLSAFSNVVMIDHYNIRKINKWENWKILVLHIKRLHKTAIKLMICPLIFNLSQFHFFQRKKMTYIIYIYRRLPDISKYLILISQCWSNS
jgi:hypothetical protein